MPDERHPEDVKQYARFVRSLLDCTQEEMAVKAGRDSSTICRYESGHYPPPPRSIKAYAAVASHPMPLVDACLLPAFRAARIARSLASGKDWEDVPAAAEELERALCGIGISAATAFLAAVDSSGTKPREQTGPPSAEDRAEAVVLWSLLESCSAEDQRYLVETCPELQTWAVAEQVCHASEEAASDDAHLALQLAGLAHRAAQLAPGKKLWQERIEGYTLIFLANARRVANEMAAAEEDFARGAKLWEAGTSTDPGLLAEWRFFDRMASLRRDQRRFPEALEALSRALSSAPPEAVGRILVNKAVTFEHMSEPEQAIEVLCEAAPLVDPVQEPRLWFGLRFNWIANLCHLGRYLEAEAMLREVQDLAASLKTELHRVRVVWLSARIDAGLGRQDEARAIFEQVQQEFTERKMAYDCALVTLELAVLCLEQGRTAEVREMAEEIVWVFKAEGIHQEAMAALNIFRTAAAKEAATADLARRILIYLEKARKNPDLRFKA